MRVFWRDDEVVEGLAVLREPRAGASVEAGRRALDVLGEGRPVGIAERVLGVEQPSVRGRLVAPRDVARQTIDAFSPPQVRMPVVVVDVIEQPGGGPGMSATARGHMPTQLDDGRG